MNDRKFLLTVVEYQIELKDKIIAGLGRYLWKANPLQGSKEYWIGDYAKYKIVINKTGISFSKSIKYLKWQKKIYSPSHFFFV